MRRKLGQIVTADKCCQYKVMQKLPPCLAKPRAAKHTRDKLTKSLHCMSVKHSSAWAAGWTDGGTVPQHSAAARAVCRIHVSSSRALSAAWQDLPGQSPFAAVTWLIPSQHISSAPDPKEEKVTPCSQMHVASFVFPKPPVLRPRMKASPNSP